MVSYGLPLVGFNLGDLIDNGNGEVSLKKPNDKYLCINPDGGIEERDAPGGPWESFKLSKSGTSLLAVRGDRVFVLPLVDVG